MLQLKVHCIGSTCCFCSCTSMAAYTAVTAILQQTYSIFAAYLQQWNPASVNLTLLWQPKYSNMSVKLQPIYSTFQLFKLILQHDWKCAEWSVYASNQPILQFQCMLLWNLYFSIRTANFQPAYSTKMQFSITYSL